MAKNSRTDKSTGGLDEKNCDIPNIALNQLRKKKVGASKYKKTTKRSVMAGKRSIKNEKKRISETNVKDPGNPRNNKQFMKDKINSLGQRRFNPLSSVMSRVLKRLLIASTSKNALAERSAWLTSMANPANMMGEEPEKIQMVSQCISMTVAYATIFFKSV